MKDFNKVAIVNYNANYMGQDYAVALSILPTVRSVY